MTLRLTPQPITQEQFTEIQTKNFMADSIGRFVLAHPDITDVIEAFTVWSETIARPAAYPGSYDYMLFCLDVFEHCIHQVTPEFIQKCLETEQRCYQRQYRNECPF